MNKPEKLATLGTQDTIRTEINKKHNTICVGHHYYKTNTNNVDKTRALLQTTGGNDEPRIVFIFIKLSFSLNNQIFSFFFVAVSYQ